MPSVVVRLDRVIKTRFYTPPLNFMSWSFLCLAWFMFYSHSHIFFQHLSKSSIRGAGGGVGLVVFSEIRNVWNLVMEIAIQKVAEIWLTFSAGEGGIARVC
jgi:hypothetical protein